MPDPLARVKRAATRRKRAEAEYRLSLQAARDEGKPTTSIAKAAGCTRQNVLLLTTQRP